MGATTRTGLITGPLRDRFGFIARLDYYDTHELISIIERAARILDVPLASEGAAEIAGRSRGTPRIANRLLKRVRDYAEVRGDGTVNADTARAALALFEVDELGLDKVDRAILTALCETFAGQPVGLTTLAVAVAEEPETVEEVYEPFLLKAGLLQRTPRGRDRDSGRVCAPRCRAARRRHASEPLRTGALAGPCRGIAGSRHYLLGRLVSEPRRRHCRCQDTMEIALVYFALLALAFFFLIVRPQRRRVTQHRAFVTAVELGDDVVTTGGIYGTIRALRGEAVELEVAPGIVITVARAAVAQRVFPTLEPISAPVTATRPRPPRSPIPKMTAPRPTTIRGADRAEERLVPGHLGGADRGHVRRDARVGQHADPGARPPGWLLGRAVTDREVRLGQPRRRS